MSKTEKQVTSKPVKQWCQSLGNKGCQNLRNGEVKAWVTVMSKPEYRWCQTSSFRLLITLSFAISIFFFSYTIFCPALRCLSPSNSDPCPPHLSTLLSVSPPLLAASLAPAASPAHHTATGDWILLLYIEPLRHLSHSYSLFFSFPSHSDISQQLNQPRYLCFRKDIFFARLSV